MKITPISSPAQVPVSGTPEASRTAKAVAAFNAGQSSYDSGQAQQDAQRPQVNANSISAEELSAVKAPQKQQVSDENVELQDSQDEQVLETSPEVSEETPVEEAPKKVEETPESRRFAQLARQEKALRAKQHQQDLSFKQREAALLEREAKLNQPQDRSNYISVDDFKADPLAMLAKSGLSYEQLTEQILTQQAVDPRITNTIKNLEAKIAQLEAKSDEGSKAVEQQQQQAYDAAVKQISQDVKSLVQNDPNFEMIKTNGAVKDVVQLIEETYRQDGILLSVEDASQQVEDYLTEEALKVTRIGKIKSRLNQAVQPVKAGTQTPKPQEQTQPTMKTLTNATSSTRKLSSRERALLAFKGEKF